MTTKTHDSKARLARRGVGICLLFSILSTPGCGTTGQAAELDPMVGFAVVDAAEQALSQVLFSDDLHSHQLKVAWSVGVRDPVQQSSLFARPDKKICTADQGVEDWSNMRCKAIQFFDWRGPPCSSSVNCSNLQIAHFVRADSRLLATVVSAVQDPCRYSPNAEQLGRRHGVKTSQGPATLVSAGDSQYWLGCRVRSPVTGAFDSIDGDGRVALRIVKVTK